MLWPFQAADAQKQAGKDVSDAGSEKAQALIDVYQFEEAESVLQKEITTAQRKKRPTDRLSEQLHQAQLGSNMLAGTEKSFSSIVWRSLRSSFCPASI